MSKIYSDFKEGEFVICISLTDNKGISYGDRVELGKEYLIVDLEYRFPNAICIKISNKRSEFLPISLFHDKAAERVFKIDKIITQDH